MKKKIIALLLMASLLLVACGAKQESKPVPDEPKETTEVEVSEETATEETVEEKIFTDDISSVQTCGQLRVEEGKLCDASGNPIQLKGVSTHAVTRTEPFINDELFYEMRTSWGINVVRLAMYILGQDGYSKSDYFREKNISLVEKGVELAVDNDLYVLVDWHVLEDKNPLEHKDEALEFFDGISAKYKDCPNVIYEICNEPNGTSWEDIKTYANEVIPVIRANAPDAVIICGTPDWSQGVDQALASPLEFDNIMYTLHFYSASHRDELRKRMVTCAEAGLPIFVTEYGVTADSGGFPRDLEEADRWMDALDEYGISSCIWNLSKNGEACCLISFGSGKYSGFEAEDFNETGEWFLNMLAE